MPLRRPIRLALGLLAGLAVLAVSLPVLASPWLRGDDFERDWCQHVWWTQRFADERLFPGDTTAEFFSRPLLAPPGHHAVYRVGVPWLGAEGTAKAFSVLLGLASLGLAWRLGRRWGGAFGVLAGLLAVVLFASQTLGLPETRWGLPRSTAPPLLLLTLLALAERRPWLLGAAFLLCVVFYPPALVTAGGTAALVLGARALSERRLPRGALAIALGGLASLALLAWTYRSGGEAEAGFGPKVTRAQAMTMPEFGPGGRSNYFSDDPVRFWLRSRRSGLGTTTFEGSVAALLLLGLLLLRRRWLPLELWALVAASLAAFLAAHATLFALHLPNRYVAVPMALLLVLGVPALASRALAAARASPWGERLAARRPPAALLLLLAAAPTVWLGVRGVEYVARARARGAIDEDRRAANRFLETLPVDAVVGAHPEDADTIPLRARRSTVANWETALPYWLGYYAGQKARLGATLRACFATDWAEVDALAGYGAKAFLVRAGRYTPAGVRRGVYPPFEAAVLAPARARHEAGAPFVLADPPPERILFRRGEWTVVRVEGP